MSLLQLEDSAVEYPMLLVSHAQSVLMLVSVILISFAIIIITIIFYQISFCTNQHKWRYSNNRTKLLSHMSCSWG